MRAFLYTSLLLRQSLVLTFGMRNGSSQGMPDAITGYPAADSSASSSTSALLPDGFSWDATGIQGSIPFLVYNPRTGRYYDPSIEHQTLTLDPVQDSPEMYAQAQANRNLFRENGTWQQGRNYKEESGNAWVRRQALLRLARLDPQNNELGSIYSDADRLVFYHPLKTKRRVVEDYNNRRLPILQRDPIDGQLTLRPPFPRNPLARN